MTDCIINLSVIKKGDLDEGSQVEGRSNFHTLEGEL